MSVSQSTNFISAQSDSFVLHKVVAHLHSEALETSPYVEKFQLDLKKNLIFNQQH